MTLTSDETKFVEFLKSFNEFYWPSHKIAENSKGVSILPHDGEKNEFHMYALDEICHSCRIFREGNVRFTPKTTDALWYKKDENNFFIFLIEFKGDFLCKTSSKCSLVEVVDSLKAKNYYDELSGEIKALDKIVDKYSDKMLNGLATKPLETVTIALPMVNSTIASSKISARSSANFFNSPNGTDSVLTPCRTTSIPYGLFSCSHRSIKRFAL